MNINDIFKLEEQDLSDVKVRNDFIAWIKQFPLDEKYLNEKGISRNDFIQFLFDKLTDKDKISQAEEIFAHFVTLYVRHEQHDQNYFVWISLARKILNFKDRIFLDTRVISKEVYIDTVSDRIIKTVHSLYQCLSNDQLVRLHELAKQYLQEGTAGDNTYWIIHSVAENLTQDNPMWIYPDKAVANKAYCRYWGMT